MGSRILFDASSTNPISEIIAVAPGACVQINAWNLAVGETAQVFRTLVELGFIGASGAGSCAPPPGVTPASIVTEGEYLPCNVPVEVGQEPNLNITTLVIQQPGYYRVHLTPAALGTAFVEAIVLNADECEAASRACCCTPETWWQGVSLNPCLTITPGGDAGHAPIFNLDACCLFQSLAPNPNPVLSDELIFLSGGACFRATIDQVFSSAIVCDSLGEQPLLAPAAGDQVVGLDAGANCKRMDGETFVEFFETPWTGISITPALVIAPGGVNGHGPTFSYDLCADIQAQASCACEPNPGDQILIVQGGACVLATWPTVDVCDQLGLLPNGALIVGDTVLVREAGGACKQVLATAFATPSFPLLAPNGSCLAPTYSFATDPTSGMFYNIVNASVVVSDANCTDFIEIGNSIDLNAATSFVRIRGGYNIPGSNCGLIVETNGLERLRIGSQGAWNLNTAGGGAAGQVITSFGSGAPPQWAAATLPSGFGPILGGDGSCLAPTYSFASSPDSGMFYDPAGLGSVIIGDDNCVDFISVGASISATSSVGVISLSAPVGGIAIAGGVGGVGIIFTTSALALQFFTGGEWLIGGTAGIAGQAIVSNGPGTIPTWQTQTGGVAEPITQIVYGTGPAVDSDSHFTYDVATGAFKVNETGGSPFAGPGARGNVTIRSSESNTGNTGGDIELLAANNPDATNAGRNINLIAGGSVMTDRAGGSITLRAGSATGPSGTAQGGSVFIFGGSNTGGASTFPGDVIIRPGSSSSSVVGGNKGVVEAGSGNGWHLRLASRSIDDSHLIGAPGNSAGDAGQTIKISGGDGHPTGPSNGGRVDIFTGQESGGGIKGRIDFQVDQGAFGSPIAHFTGSGDMVMAGYGQGTNGTQDTILLAGATTGFLWPPRIGGAPVGVPAGTNIPGGTTYANPVTIEQEGGQTCLWVYNFAAAAWHSTCFNAGGAIATPAFPLLGADGSCAAPTYSFTSSPDSGMFYDPAGLGKVVIGDDNCFDKIEIGASINIIVGGGHAVGTGGGAVTIQAARSITAAAGGNVNINAGKADGAGAGGFLLFEAGRGGGTGPGGSIQLECGLSGVTDGGDYTVITGSSPGRGGRFSVNMGAGNTGVSSTNAEAGFVWPGAPASTNFGSFGLYTGGIIAGGRIFTMDNSGDMTFHGSVGSAGTKHIYSTRDITLGRTDLVAASASGFPWIPTVPAAPTGVPVAFGGCVPMVAQETGGTIVLWMYEFGTATWRNVVLA